VIRIAHVKDYGNGLLEAGYTTVGNHPPLKAKRGESENREENRRRSFARSKANIRRRCMAGGFDYLLTLTYADLRTELEPCKVDLDRFRRKVQKVLGRSWGYVAVAEYQLRGAVHFHLGVRGWQNVGLLRTLWREATGDARANIDVRAPKVGKRLRWGRLRLAYYLAKYLGKSAAVDMVLNRKSYSVTRGIPGPKVESFTIPLHYHPMGYLRNLLGRVGWAWEGKDGLFGCLTSWSLADTGSAAPS
jgi:hypothetical protein